MHCSAAVGILVEDRLLGCGHSSDCKRPLHARTKGPANAASRIGYAAERVPLDNKAFEKARPRWCQKSMRLLSKARRLCSCQEILAMQAGKALDVKW